MAGQVNKKFVAMLVGASVLVLGGGVALYWFQFNKTGEDYVRQAREAEAIGDWEAAEELWGRAVGHEKTNILWLDGWAEALGNYTPATETEFRDKFQQLRGIKRQVAVTARTDADRTAEYLEFLLETFRRQGGASRLAVENFANEVEFMLAYYPEGGPLDGARSRLRRYRGIAWSLLSGASSTLTEEEIRDAEADLAAALSVDPADGEAMRAMVRLIGTRRARADAIDDRERAAALLAEQRAAVAAVLAADPDNMWGLVTALDLDADAFNLLTGEERESDRGSLYARLEELMERADAMVATIDADMLERLMLLEGLLTADGDRTPRAIELYEKVVEAQPAKTDLLIQLAALKQRNGLYEEAMEAVRRAETQESLPVSLDGSVRIQAKTQAPRFVAEFAIGRIGPDDEPAEVERLLTVASEARERFARGVNKESAQLPMLDGKIAAARANFLLEQGNQREAETALSEALGHFARYNTMTQDNSRDGLWLEGRTALRLNKSGVARDRFSALLRLDPRNPSVLLGLAEVEEMLGTQSSLEEALRYTEQAAALAPGNAMIRERIERLRRLTFKEVSDDPIEAIVFESERMFQGVDQMAPDAIAAERIVRDGIGEHGQEPRLVRQLVRVLMFTDRIDEAREAAEAGLAANPDSEILEAIRRRLSAGSMLEIMEITIDQSNASPLDKLLQKAEVRRQNGEIESAREALDEAVATAPDDPDVMEQQFLMALDVGNMDMARAVTARAKALNADRLDGITYEARVLAAENRHAESVELLREAVSRRPSDAPLWRLLASEQSALGRVSEALDSYRKALSITVNDRTTIRGYIALLAVSGQLEQALSEARRLREFAESDPAFNDIYLRLEANEGGGQGLATAIRIRERMVGEQPFNIGNKIELARLYTDARRWEDAKALLDQLEAEGEESLARVEALAKWYADQGRVRREDGYKDGIDLARGAFIEYIVGTQDREQTVDAYIAMAQFMMRRGRDEIALRAVEEARSQQDPKTLRAEKLYGEILMNGGMWRAAGEAFTTVINAGADDQRDTYRKLLVEMLLRTNEFEAARQQIDALPAEIQEDLTVLMQRADIAVAQNRQEDAMRLVDRAIELYPSRPLPFIKRAQFLMPNEALARDVMRNLDEALRLNPNDFQAHKLMATMHYRQGDQARALESLRASLRANPGQDPVLVGMLIELLEQERVGEALDVANEVIAARPTDATLMLLTGRVFMRRDYFDRAATLFEKAWELTRDQRVAMAYIDALLRSSPAKVQRASQVIAQLEVLGAQVNDDPQLLATRAMLEAKGDKMARAASFLTRAYEQSLGNPGLVLQWFRNARMVFDDDGERTVEYMNGLRGSMPAGTVQRDWLTYGIATTRIQDEREIEEAESDLRQLQADGAEELIKRLAHRLMGTGRYARGDYDGAAAAWRTGIEAFPDDWEMHNNLAYCVGVDQGRPTEGVPLARQAAQLADARADVYDTLGILLLNAGELDEAEDALLKAKERVRTERERVSVLLNQARLALKKGKPVEAKRLWTEADTAVYTLPDLREVVGEDLAEVKQEIDSAPTAD